MKARCNSIWKATLILIPFVLGMIGFMSAGDSFLQAVYQCICLYGMGHKDIPANLLIEIARWLAPIATAGSLLFVVKKIRTHVHGIVARCTGKSVAVYGPEIEKEAMLKLLGVRGIDMEGHAVKARSYILLGSETDNLHFYSNYLKDRKGEVYIKSTNLPAQASNQANLHFFNAEEIAAKLFWNQFSPYELSKKHGHSFRIAIIGFGKLGKELLLSGLQNNIFSATQQIEYHIWGQEDGFRQVYHQLDQISDPVIFHQNSWKMNLDFIQQADMVIVAEQQEQLAILRDLTMVLPDKTIHVMSAQSEGVDFLSGQTKLICFDWKLKTMDPEHILSERIYTYAKRINLRYAHLYTGAEENDKSMEEQWLRLDTFTRYSNISAADYHSIQLKMLDGDELTEDKLETLAELEHTRWCRYHYLNNWSFGIPENGKNKDPQKRIHALLIPYADLSEAEKQKDRDNILLFMQLDKEMNGQ